ncbi:hypothetical protein [Cupriavidus agavae]|uniref:Uncharacterized protein n=1 Tax=Cupriavidus agavae TaxID=1001822 RepID=A0A4V2FEC2_9BURK|nr:hypothetical protein [Cupriavidus agavae]RZT29269.1 hypothetical protein EV147_4899 [Cupriavidus agavae]
MRFTKFFTALALAGLSVSAFAGPDWTVIERARDAARHAHAASAQSQAQGACVQASH